MKPIWRETYGGITYGPKVSLCVIDSITITFRVEDPERSVDDVEVNLARRGAT
jgi:hypothetical protein